MNSILGKIKKKQEAYKNFKNKPAERKDRESKTVQKKDSS